VGTSAIPLIVQKVKARRLFVPLNRSKENFSLFLSQFTISPLLTPSLTTLRRGAFKCREAKWITQARLPHFHSSGKSELPLDRDLLCVTTLPSLGTNFGLLRGPKFSLIRVYKYYPTKLKHNFHDSSTWRQRLWSHIFHLLWIFVLLSINVTHSLLKFY
jgi:hypothetical protein